MNRGIVTLNDITNGLININIMKVQIINSKKMAEYWCRPSTDALTLSRSTQQWTTHFSGTHAYVQLMSRYLQKQLCVLNYIHNLICM